MLTRLAAFLYAHGRRVLVGAVILAVVAGAFGFGVAKDLWPYGAKDPATQSVQATNRFQAAASRQIDAGVVALVSSGDVGTRRRAAAGRTGCGAAAQAARCRSGAVVLHDPQPGDGLSRRPVHLRARVLQAAVRQGAEERRPADREPLRRTERRQARRRRRRQRAGQHQGQPRPGARRAARVPVHLPALVPVLPIAAWRRCCRPCWADWQSW